MDHAQSVNLSESLEDYIEAIFRIILEKHEVKPKDIARALNVAGASVTGALRMLTEKGLIHYAPYDDISLTPKGELIAEEIYNRHLKLKSFLKNMLQIEEKEADETACRMEHAVSTRIINKLVRFAEFIESCPRGGRLWISGFEHNCDPDDKLENCRECVLVTLERIEQKQSQKKVNQ
ncbi:MAG: metal-dependent transcriptional regulator [Planctomycetia bacterium]|nr:metal-dependent transcriptional regulator [Planctomycetia bacterium]